jgi:hypothetical protein
MSTDLVVAEEFVEQFLAHYADPYYDPIKAHEYYLQNRQLKGRQSTKGMSQTQKEALGYAKNQLAVAKKGDLQTAATANKQAMQQLHAAATARRDEITAKLKDLFAGLKTQTTSGNKVIEAEKQGKLDDLTKRIQAQADEISAKAVEKIKALPPVPDGVSDKRRVFLSAQRAAAAAQIHNDANAQLQKVVAAGRTESAAIATDAQSKHAALSVSTKGQQQTARAGATADRATVAANVKAMVAQASADYKARREALNAAYDTKTQQEYDAIKKNLPSAPKGKKKGGKSKKPNKFFVL